MRPLTELEYVEYYADKIRRDNRFFAQQRSLIESQLKSSRSVFKSMFSDENFKNEAREYLKGIRLLKN